jgi:hypothetical protein
MEMKNKESAKKLWKKLNKTERKVFIHQVKDRLGWCHNLKILFASTGQTGISGKSGFNALQSLEKKGIIKTLERKSESNTRMTRMGGKMEFWTDGTWIIDSNAGLDILNLLIDKFEKRNAVNRFYDQSLERKPSHDLG